MYNGQNQDQSMFSNAVLKWIDDRFPLSSLIREHATDYYASKKFQYLVYLWCFIFGRFGNSIADRDILNHELQALSNGGI